MPRSFLLNEPSRTLARSIVARTRIPADRFVLVQGVAAAIRQIEAATPAAVITAFELPGMSGPSLVAAIRAEPRYRAVPIALITASDPERVACVGADVVLPKDTTLAAQLCAWLEQVGGRELVSGTDGAGGRILLAEDAASIQKLLGRMLHAAGFEVYCVSDGAEALAAAAAHQFDLVLMDIEMPRVDGLTAARQMRAEGLAAPILALSAHGDKAARAARAAGMQQTLAKPIGREALVSACRVALQGAAGAAVPASGASTSAL